MGAGDPGRLVSVVMPAFNAGKYIARTIASVCAQSHRDLEIIVVDDNSTDDTAALVEEAAAKDGRISLLRSPQRGASKARNLGISRAHGRYIAPIDADDLWTRDKLARQLAILEAAGRDTGVVYCWAAGIDDDEKIVLPVWNASRASGDVLHEIIKSGILSCGSTPLIRTKYVEAVGGYDEALGLGEDWKFYTALAGVCRFEVIPECLTGYRIRSDSTSLHVEPMERALEECTAWIVANWPETPREVLAEREFTLNAYLAFLAIRTAQYARVPRYLLRATSARPSRLLGPEIWQLAALAPAHAAGLRRYDWKLWQRPKQFPQ